MKDKNVDVESLKTDFNRLMDQFRKSYHKLEFSDSDPIKDPRFVLVSECNELYNELRYKWRDL